VSGAWPTAWGAPAGSAVIRRCPEDFAVTEEPGFALSGDGEHVFLYLEKRCLNTAELAARIAELAGVPPRDVGYSGMKDRNAVTRQWFSVGLAGRQAPDWQALQSAGDVRVLETGRHLRKLRRGTHRGNRFRLRLCELRGSRAALEARLALLRERGAPNYFGEQRFGRGGSTLAQARRWAARGGRVSRARRGLFLSALRAWLFNQQLGARVQAGTWERVLPGDVCMLAGSRSFFTCDEPDAQIQARLQQGDLHPGLPLWGRGGEVADAAAESADSAAVRRFLEAQGVDLAWRPTRLLPDDFCWEFCDDDGLQLDFALGAGSYATALLAEFVHYTDGSVKGGTGCEQV